MQYSTIETQTPEQVVLSQGQALTGKRCPELDALTGQVRDALKCSGYHSLERIEVTTNGRGAVRLEGDVSSYYLKQIAQTLAMAVDGVRSLDNAVVVWKRE